MDFLTVSFHLLIMLAIDRPRFMEQDTYLRLDQTIADLRMDKTVGKDNHLLFLTADHAGAEEWCFERS
jgi:hypothetical protein